MVDLLQFNSENGLVGPALNSINCNGLQLFFYSGLETVMKSL